ncbi:endonuclease/exonuclease/phosphatase family protein [Microbacterium sp.]|uniref:endonuclease/exonuclease/phosphatase family protein n=1 Tax=Microbacterium sp. TaxID=51671 RepID=UPI002811F431|nr:endonuclease/exonuclease/phosphatase family protein [Microbacterium sp.]
MNDALIGPAAAPDLHVMSFNVRRDLGKLAWLPADRWPTRVPRVAALLRQERPSVLGVQEALPHQAVAIREALGGEYRFVGHGRRPGHRGEGCPLFLDTARLELLDWRQTWLSDRPDEAGSTSWGNLIPRVIVRATLRDRATSKRFIAVNTHLDAFSPTARRCAAAEVRRLVADQTLPAIVTGDFNAGPSSAPMQALLSEGALTDAWTAASARLTPEWRTFTGYRDPRRGARIDAILVSAGVGVLRTAINARRFGGSWPSDHLPVQALVRMPPGERDRMPGGAE